MKIKKTTSSNSPKSWSLLTILISRVLRSKVLLNWHVFPNGCQAFAFNELIYILILTFSLYNWYSKTFHCTQGIILGVLFMEKLVGISSKLCEFWKFPVIKWVKQEDYSTNAWSINITNIINFKKQCELYIKILTNID